MVRQPIINKKRKKFSLSEKKVKNKNVLIKQKSEASRAVDKFIIKMNKRFQTDIGKNISKKNTERKKSVFKAKPIFIKEKAKMSNKKNVKKKVKKNNFIKAKGLDFEKILNNFSLYSKVNEPFLPMNDISLSTINHSGFKNLKYNKKRIDKACMTDFEKTPSFQNMEIEDVLSYLSSKIIANMTKIFNNKQCSFYYSNANISKVENNTTKNNISNLDLNKSKMRGNKILNYSEKENDSFSNDESIGSFNKLKGSNPIKYEKMLKKMYKKIKGYEKKSHNLERQLRNRNKDYLYALKEIEQIKVRLN